jgi:DNA modification methylase
MKTFHDGKITLHAGDCLDVLKAMPENSIDAVVTDPPYHLTSIVKRFGGTNAAPAKGNEAFIRASRGFMGKQWDGGDIAFRPELWAEVLRVLKPGGHIVAFSGTRTYHRMAVAIEDAGFEVRDQLAWVYGSGFPKSHDVSKGIDRQAGADRPVIGTSVSGIGVAFGDGKWVSGKSEFDLTAPATNAARQWQGYGTALKPAHEPICLARKPLSESTVAANVLRWGTGALNIDGCRIETSDGYAENAVTQGVGTQSTSYNVRRENRQFQPATAGRWPANLCHDGSPEVLAGFPETGPSSGGLTPGVGSKTNASAYQFGDRLGANAGGLGDSGSSARFFASFPQEEARRFYYTSKANADDRLRSAHPTVKPVDLMQWLVRLVCPKGATVLDPFAGTGTTGAASFIEGRRCVLIEREAEYLADIEKRMGMLLSGFEERSWKLAKPEPLEALPLFGGL